MRCRWRSLPRIYLHRASSSLNVAWWIEAFNWVDHTHTWIYASRLPHPILVHRTCASVKGNGPHGNFRLIIVLRMWNTRNYTSDVSEISAICTHRVRVRGLIFGYIRGLILNHLVIVMDKRWSTCFWWFIPEGSTGVHRQTGLFTIEARVYNRRKGMKRRTSHKQTSTPMTNRFL